MLAICPNTPELWVYVNCADPDPSQWERRWILKQHDFVISGVDWCAATNKIVTCSHDRQAFVWNYVEGDAAALLLPQQLDVTEKPNAAVIATASATSGNAVVPPKLFTRPTSSASTASSAKVGAASVVGAWKPQVVVLNINRAALDVRWSPDGQKFAVASGAKVVMICSFDSANDWWISKPAKKHKSSALTVAWHPNGQVLASVATDYRCRIMSAFLEDVDTSGPDGAQFGGNSLPEVGEVVAEFEVTRAWLNDCCWSASGTSLAFVGHDSMLHVATYPSNTSSGGAIDDPIIQSIKCPTLPGTRVLFLSETLLVVAGHGMNPELFTKSPDDSIWRFACYADRKAEADKGAIAAVSSMKSARELFVNKTTKGQASSTTEELWTRHNNAITYLKSYKLSSSGNISAFSTSGDDGRVVIWDLVKINPPELNLQSLGLL